MHGPRDRGDSMRIALRIYLHFRRLWKVYAFMFLVMGILGVFLGSPPLLIFPITKSRRRNVYMDTAYLPSRSEWR